jgi:hypothetical protein
MWDMTLPEIFDKEPRMLARRYAILLLLLALVPVARPKRESKGRPALQAPRGLLAQAAQAFDLLSKSVADPVQSRAR